MMAVLGTRKILIVDDDPLDREVYKGYLSEAWGDAFSVAEESTALAGIARCASFEPDCILLDFNLPDTNGLDVLEALKKDSAAALIPVVMLTAIRDERIAVEAMKSGVMDYLPKGQLAAETLAYAIDNAVGKARMQREIESQRAALEASEGRYRGLIAAIPQMVWTASPRGAIEYSNSRWVEYLGELTDQRVEIGWLPLMHADDRDRFLDAWLHGLASDNAFQIEHRLKQRSDGSYRWHLSRAVPIQDDHGRIVEWFGTSTDIEDQKRGEAALQAKQKLESIGLLAGGIAHDFNNILTGILGWASLAADMLPRSHALQPALNSIVTSAERAAHLTGQMLAYAGKGRFLIEEIDFGTLVQSSCDLIKASIPKHVTIQLRVRSNLPAIDGDSSQLQQIAMNLVLNAAEAIPPETSGTVWVRVEALFLNQEVIRSLTALSGDLSPGPFVFLEVKDTGVGMDAATRARIFDPFFTTKFTGRGLGLSAVQGILRSHKGAVQIESEPGKGSTFRVYIPASTAPARVKENPPVGKTTVGSGTVLVIDDEAIVRQTAKGILVRAGYHVLLAEGGEEALPILSAQRGEIALILLDLSMPGMDGKQVMKLIRKLGIDAPILICSGYSESEVYTEFAGLDIAGVIAKPFAARMLALRVGAVLDSREAHQRQD
jgi:PAS domain S-box-containing protein